MPGHFKNWDNIAEDYFSDKLFIEYHKLYKDVCELRTLIESPTNNGQISPQMFTIFKASFYCLKTFQLTKTCELPKCPVVCLNEPPVDLVYEMLKQYVDTERPEILPLISSTFKKLVRSLDEIVRGTWMPSGGKKMEMIDNKVLERKYGLIWVENEN